MLQHPADHFPKVFHGEFWLQFPYFLPSAIAAGFAIICFLMILFFLHEVSGNYLPVTPFAHYSPDSTEKTDSREARVRSRWRSP
jgi:hypothetical protein